LETQEVRIGISPVRMIAGNPKAGRMLVTFSVGLLLLILVSAAIIAIRKGTAPEKQPPLPMHPSNVILRAWS